MRPEHILMPTELRRFLATVLFADMVGYSRLMDEDEDAAIRTRQRMEGVLRQVIPAHGGEIIQFYGDGALVLFPNTLDAVRCAGHLQRQFREKPAIPMRIGIHTGEVSRDRYNIYGDPVNIASRIESFAVPGSVLFSDKVYNDLHNHPSIEVSLLGTFQLKNIREPVRLYALADHRLVVPSASELKGKGEEKRHSIAVLPFINMSADPENEIFSDGIAEELLNALTQVEDLQVLARTSSFAYKGQNVDVRQIGKELRVDTVLEGSVRKVGNQVRITAQLVNTSDGYHLLSVTYDRHLDDIFAVQDEIAHRIAEELLNVLGLQQPSPKLLASKATDSIEAYQLYLKGSFYWRKYNPGDILKALFFLEEAVRLDPAFGLAWAGISVSYSFLGGTGRLPAQAAFQKAWDASEQALQLNDRSEKAHCARGLVHLFRDWDFISADRAFMRAKSLIGDDTFFAKSYSTFLIARGRFQEAVEILESALNLDPFSLILNISLAEGYIQTGEYEAAHRIINQMLEFYPDTPNFRLLKGLSYYFQQEYEKGLSILKGKIDPTDPIFSEFIAWRGYGFIKTGEIERARGCLRRLEQLYESESATQILIDLAFLQHVLGHTYAAFQLLYQVLKEHSSGLIFILYSRRWSSLRADMRFQAFREKMEVRE